MPRVLKALAVALALASLWGGAAEAQEKKKAKVLRLDEITVEGRIQKPTVFYSLSRANLNFDALNRKESFLPKIVKSVEKDPF